MKNGNELKLTLYGDGRIVIENYQKLLDLKEELIKVDIYTIVGNFLKLTRMDSYMLEVVGSIHQVLVG